MDQFNTCIGMSHLAGRKSQSLVEWNAQYEAMSLENDWWFKAAVSVAKSIRGAITALASGWSLATNLARA
jgi:hypothetical protein